MINIQLNMFGEACVRDVLGFGTIGVIKDDALLKSQRYKDLIAAQDRVIKEFTTRTRLDFIADEHSRLYSAFLNEQAAPAQSYVPEEQRRRIDASLSNRSGLNVSYGPEVKRGKRKSKRY